MARPKKRKAHRSKKHRTISYTVVGSEPNMGQVLAHRAREEAEAGRCGDARNTLKYAGLAGGGTGPIAKQIAKICARRPGYAGLGSDTHYVDPRMTDRANSSDRDLRWQQAKAKLRRGARGAIMRDLTDEYATRAQARRDAEEARLLAASQAAADAWYDSDDFYRDEWIYGGSLQTEPFETFAARRRAEEAAKIARYRAEEADAPRRARISWAHANRKHGGGFTNPLIPDDDRVYARLLRAARKPGRR